MRRFHASVWRTVVNAVVMTALVFGPTLFVVERPVRGWLISLYLAWAVLVIVGDALFVAAWNRRARSA